MTGQESELTKNVSIRFTLDTHACVEVLARADETSIQQLVMGVVDRHLATQEAREAIRGHLADVTAALDRQIKVGP